MSFRSALLFAAVSAFVMIVAVCFFQCGLEGKAPSERAVARGAVLTTAEAVKAADQACATYGAAAHDVALLSRCEEHYNLARATLVATGSAVDLWERVESRQSVTCALERALSEVMQIGQELDARGAAPPKVIADARALVAALGGCSDA